jgi:RNA polymerase sigma factor (sigma-70 family)
MPQPGSLKIEELIDGCLRHERKAQQMLFEKFFPKFFSIAYKYVLDEDDAQDVVQEAFVKIFSKMAEFKSEGVFEGWMRRIVVNQSIDHIRKRKKNTFAIDELQISDDSATEDVDNLSEDMKLYQEIIDKLGMEAVTSEINQLSPAYRIIMNLYFVERMKHHEIAEQLGINIGTSKSNLFKARRKLKEKLIALLNTKTHV